MVEVTGFEPAWKHNREIYFVNKSPFSSAFQVRCFSQKHIVNITSCPNLARSQFNPTKPNNKKDPTPEGIGSS